MFTVLSGYAVCIRQLRGSQRSDKEYDAIHPASESFRAPRNGGLCSAWTPACAWIRLVKPVFTGNSPLVLMN